MKPVDNEMVTRWTQFQNVSDVPIDVHSMPINKKRRNCFIVIVLCSVSSVSTKIYNIIQY